MNPRKLTFGAVGAVLLVALAIGGYFLAGTIEKVHEENVNSLASFGSVVTPASTNNYGEDGQEFGQAPTIGSTKISATDKVIIALSKEKQELIKELGQAKLEIEDLKQQVALLENYQQTNERYAPRLMGEERDFAVKSMTEYLEGSPDAARFTQFQKDAMVQQTANVYVDLVRRFHLNVTEKDRKKLMEDYLPTYAFCFGTDIAFVANTKREEGRLLSYLQTGDKTILPPKLLQDIEVVNTPCLADLNEQTNPLFRADLR